MNADSDRVIQVMSYNILFDHPNKQKEFPYTDDDVFKYYNRSNRIIEEIRLS